MVEQNPIPSQRQKLGSKGQEVDANDPHIFWLYKEVLSVKLQVKDKNIVGFAATVASEHFDALNLCDNRHVIL